MQAQIRLAESGHSYHYSQLTTVHALMQQIRKDFKIELEDQKIIMKSGEILKSSISFDSIQELMKKTISTNMSSQANPSIGKSNQMKQIQCLYIYNQKQLLKPIQIKSFNEEFYLKILRQKCKQMSSLAQNSYEFKHFSEKVTQKNIIPIIQSINKRLKNPLQNIAQRYSRFLDILSQRNYSKLQISALLDLIQNQDKARKLLIRNIQYLFDRKTKKRFSSIVQKLSKQAQRENQLGLKQNSSFFSSSKGSQFSQGLSLLNGTFKDIQKKYNKFYQKLKQSKKQVIKEKFLEQQKITFRIDKKATSIQKDYQQNVKLIKESFDDFCQQIVKVNTSLPKSKEKDVKDLFRNLFLIHEKILTFEKKIEDSIKEFTQMYLQLSKIHMKGETQNIKIVFEIYVELIKSYDQLDLEIRKLEKQFQAYKEGKSRDVPISEFNENRNCNLPLKKIVRSPKKEEKKIEKQEGSISKQMEIDLPKINSPIKNKIGKNSLKILNEEITSRNFQAAISENKQLARRLQFNKRLEGLVKYFSNLCQKQQEMRRNFRNSKEFDENKIDLLGSFNVPSIEIDYNETSDLELTHLYKKWMKQNSVPSQTEVDWQSQVVECANSVSKTLTTYLASKSNTSERQRNIEKILSVLSDTFYKMMKSKLEKQTQKISTSLKERIESEQKQLITSLIESKKDLTNKLKRMQESAFNSEKTEQTQMGNRNIKHILEVEQMYSQLSISYSKIESQSKSIRDENQSLKLQVKNLEDKLLSYQEEVNQTTQKLIQSYEESNADEVEKLGMQLKTEKDSNFSLNKEIKELKNEIEKAKKNLIRQVQTSETLCKEIEQLSGEKEFYEKQFADLKNMLADKEVAIIKLQKEIQALNLNSSEKKEIHDDHQDGVNNHPCDCQQQVELLKQDKELLQQQIQNLDRELKEILFKETDDKQIQTDENIQVKLSENQRSAEENGQTSKISDNRFLCNNPINQLATKQANISNFGFSQAASFETQNHAVSQYYISSMAQQWSTAFPTFFPISIGKSIEQGMCHIFLPFSNDIYIGVTANQDTKNHTSYQQYVNEYNGSKDPIYILDMKKFNHKTKQMLSQCSLVLVVRVEKKSQISIGNKIMVNGKIQFALGFQDEDMAIKNYSHFLQQ